MKTKIIVQAVNGLVNMKLGKASSFSASKLKFDRNAYQEHRAPEELEAMLVASQEFLKYSNVIERLEMTISANALSLDTIGGDLPNLGVMFKYQASGFDYVEVIGSTNEGNPNLGFVEGQEVYLLDFETNGKRVIITTLNDYVVAWIFNGTVYEYAMSSPLAEGLPEYDVTKLARVA